MYRGPNHKYNSFWAFTVPCTIHIYNEGYCKTWTLNSGLDSQDHFLLIIEPQRMRIGKSISFAVLPRADACLFALYSVSGAIGLTIFLLCSRMEDFIVISSDSYEGESLGTRLVFTPTKRPPSPDLLSDDRYVLKLVRSLV